MLKIVSVELRNIKSYAAPGLVIPFRPGVNLIWGENGSGKTTLLEAIGFALFGSLELDLKQFRRKGENEGEIILTLEGSDERYYKIIRRIRNSADLEVRDAESNQKLSKTRDEAQHWISQVVGVEFGGFGKTLFENVLGVSQGRMVESFLQTPAVRKGIFEPILKLEGYQQTWDYLGKAQSELTGRITKDKMEAAKLEGRLTMLPDLRQELNRLWEQIAQDEKTHHDLCDRLVEQTQAFEVLEAGRQRLDQLEKQAALAANRVESGAREVQHAQKLWEEAAEAAKELEICSDGYQIYQKADAERVFLDSQRKERGKLKQALQKVETCRVETFTRLEQIQNQLDEVEQAEQQIIEMEPLVQEQKKLEALIMKKLQEVTQWKQALENQEKLAVKLSDLEGQLDKTRQALTPREEVEAALQANQKALNELLPLITDLHQEAEALQQDLEQAHGQLHQLDLQVQAWEQLQIQLNEKNADLDKDRQALILVESSLAERAVLQETVKRLRQQLETEQFRLTLAKSKQEHAAKQITQLTERRVLLQQVESAECPVCKKPLAVHEASQIDKEFAAEIDALETLQSQARAEEKGANAVIRRLKQTLEEQTARLEQLHTAETKQQLEAEIARKEAAISELEEQVEAGRNLSEQRASQQEQVHAIREQISTLEVMRKQRNEERVRLDRIVAAQNKELAGLPQPEQAASLEKTIMEYRDEAAKYEQLARSLSPASVELAQAQEALQQLGNPGELQARSRGVAGQRKSLEAQRDSLKTDLDNQDAERSSLLEALKAFDELDARLKETEDLLSQHRRHYQRYLANEQAAGMLTSRQQELARLVETQKALEQQLLEVTEKRDDAHRAFDADRYRALSEQIQANTERKVALETRLNLQRQEADAKQATLDELLRVEDKHQDALREINRLEKLAQVLGFVRENIRKAGPQIAQRRVQAVSHSANRIFRQILTSGAETGVMAHSDPGTLTWDNTYEVKVCRSGEDLVFKQLSGGEKMAAAIAVRIALLSQMTSSLRLLFLDEPTANMDDARRSQLADQIIRLEGLNQLFVITHDDAFERAAHHVLQVSKQNDVSLVNIKS